MSTAKKAPAKRTPAKKATTPRAPRPAAAKVPQDRQPKKAIPADAFTFEAGEGEDRQTYVLPKMTPGVASQVPGDITYDLLMNPSDAFTRTRLAFATLHACEPDEDVLAALKSLPSDEMIRIVGNWMGESSGSSD